MLSKTRKQIENGENNYMINKRNINIILPCHAWNYKYIKKAGLNVIPPYKGKTLISRCVRTLFFLLHLPGQCIWYNKKALINNTTLFVIESLITDTYIKWLHKNTTGTKIILFYMNPVNSTVVNPNNIKDGWCEKWSADINDCQLYNMHLYKGGIYFKQWKVIKQKPKFDVFYVGKDKGRLEKILSLKKCFEKMGMTTFFYIVADRSYKIQNDKYHRPFLSYEQVLDFLGKTKAILHLSEGCQKGITLRVQESLIHKIKLITDDKDIVQYDFYNSNNIFILGKDDMKKLPDFLNTPYIDVNSQFFEHPYYEDMVEEIAFK